MRITKIYCLDCKMEFDRKMGHSSLWHSEKDNKVMDGETILTCVYCGKENLCLADYKKNIKKT